MDKLKKLEELKNLLDSDSITQEEYDSLKKEVLERKGNDDSVKTNTQESKSIKPWNKTGWGIFIQIIFWPLGLFMIIKGLIANHEQSESDKPWYLTNWGIVIQVIIWPLGLFLMFKNKYFNKITRISIATVLIILTAYNNLKPTNTCDCVNSIGRFDDGGAQYNACIKKYLNKAFKYYDNSPQKFSSSEALVQSYIMEKCDK
jgi:hypothetical protein